MTWEDLTYQGRILNFEKQLWSAMVEAWHFQSFSWSELCPQERRHGWMTERVIYLSGDRWFDPWHPRSVCQSALANCSLWLFHWCVNMCVWVPDEQVGTLYRNHLLGVYMWVWMDECWQVVQRFVKDYKKEPFKSTPFSVLQRPGTENHSLDVN